MRVLLVGAGAVGQVYGWHFAQGGADVAFLVRPRHRETLQAGLPLYPHPHRKHAHPLSWSGFGVCTSGQEAAAWAPDVVVLCTPSNALREAWLGELVKALPADITWLCLAAGMDDADLVRTHTGAERLLVGLIALISYPGPLPGETRQEPGMVWWFPPLSSCPFAGSASRLGPVLQCLRAGGMPVSHKPRLQQNSAWPNAILMPFLVALELANWSFDALKQGDGMSDAAASIRETTNIVAARLGRSAPLWTRLVGALTLRFVLWAAELVVPLPLEAYLRFHFTKVGAQTRMFIDGYENTAKALAVATPVLNRNAERLRVLDHSSSLAS